MTAIGMVAMTWKDRIKKLEEALTRIKDLTANDNTKHDASIIHSIAKQALTNDMG